MAYPIEEVVWADHYSTDEWMAHDDQSLDEEYLITSVGARIKETKTKIVLALNIASNGKIASTITILKKTVRSRHVLREAQ